MHGRGAQVAEPVRPERPLALCRRPFHGDRHGKPLVIPILPGHEADGEPVGFPMYPRTAPTFWRFPRRPAPPAARHRPTCAHRLIEQMRADGHEWVETSGCKAARPNPLPVRRVCADGEIEDGEITARLPAVGTAEVRGMLAAAPRKFGLAPLGRG